MSFEAKANGSKFATRNETVIAAACTNLFLKNMICGVGLGLFIRQVSSLCMFRGSPCVTAQLFVEGFGYMIEGDMVLVLQSFNKFWWDDLLTCFLMPFLPLPFWDKSWLQLRHTTFPATFTLRM